MIDEVGRDKDAAVEIGEEEMGSRLGTVKADDADMLGTDQLDAGMENAAQPTEDRCPKNAKLDIHPATSRRRVSSSRSSIGLVGGDAANKGRLSSGKGKRALPTGRSGTASAFPK